MTGFYYAGEGQKQVNIKTLPDRPLKKMIDPSDYQAEEGLRHAVDVALELGQPLLLTGEPGSGKTQLAYSLAWERSLEPVLKFETKSTSTWRDLFYSYDTLGRFYSAQIKKRTVKDRDFITFNALGKAIIQTMKKEEVPLVIRNNKHQGPQRSVVLIDEVDKAPRDFPNDILNELEFLSFKIPEMNNIEVKADNSLAPIVIITSNSEKNLPDAFLRRCVYYDLPFPKGKTLRRIVAARIEAFKGQEDHTGPLLADALEFFGELRSQSGGLHKRPATAELLGWLLALLAFNTGVDQTLRQIPELVEKTLTTLTKTREDQTQAKAIWESWKEKSPKA